MLSKLKSLSGLSPAGIWQNFADPYAMNPMLMHMQFVEQWQRVWSDAMAFWTKAASSQSRRRTRPVVASMSRMIVVVLCSAGLAACSALPGLGSSDKPKVAFESNPPGANVFLSPGNANCKTPCSVPAPEKTGSYNAMFILAGYIQQTIPVRVTATKEHWYSSEAVEVSPNPVTAVLQLELGAPTGRR